MPSCREKTGHVASKDIVASPLGVGFECLDRMMFDPRRAYARRPDWASNGHVARPDGRGPEAEKPGEYDFAWLDEVADSLLAEGVQPWFSVSYGNRLYGDPAARQPGRRRLGPILTHEARSAWLRYTRTLVRRSPIVSATGRSGTNRMHPLSGRR